MGFVQERGGGGVVGGVDTRKYLFEGKEGHSHRGGKKQGKKKSCRGVRERGNGSFQNLVN